MKKLVAPVSLDTEGAFDSAWCPAVVKDEREVDAWIFNTVCSYLEDRRVTLNYLGETVTSKTEKRKDGQKP